MAAGHQIELSDEVYAIVEQEAAREGLTPEEWIAATAAREHSKRNRPAPDRAVIDQFIGAFDSSTATPDPRYRTAYGDSLAEKYRRQGLNIP